MNASPDRCRSNRHTRPANRRARAAFTLIELLVVIAIITLLLGLLVPSLKRVVDLTHRTVCTNHARVISHACINYAEGFDEYGPPQYGGEWPVWPDYLASYWGERPKFRTRWDPWRATGGCPTFQVGYWSAMADCLSIAINGSFTGLAYKNATYRHKITDVNIPAEVMMSCDGAFPTSGHSSNSGPPSLLRNRMRGDLVLIYRRHEGEGLSFGFLDGSADFRVYLWPTADEPYGRFAGSKFGSRPN